MTVSDSNVAFQVIIATLKISNTSLCLVGIIISSFFFSIFIISLLSVSPSSIYLALSKTRVHRPFDMLTLRDDVSVY